MGCKGADLKGRSHQGIDVYCLERRGLRQVFATALPTASDDWASLFRQTQRLLGELQAEVLEMRVFGAIDAYPYCDKALAGEFGRVDWPVTYIQGDSCLGHSIAGIQMHAVAGASVDTLHLDGSPVGRVFEDGYARYCVLGALRPHNGSKSREAQARDAIEHMERGLALAGMDLRCVVRTWFFISDILEWYRNFNSVRTETYTARGLFDRYVPASTGIGGRNPDDAAVVATALALQAKSDDVVVRELPSPLQCSARDYGSSFSRAAEVSTPDFRSVLVSGTASIDRDGRTAHAGDVDAQVRLTLEVVAAILQSRGMRFTDVTRANAYFKHARDVGALSKYGSQFGLPAARVVVSHNDICRDELLFEIEVDAVRPGSGG